MGPITHTLRDGRTLLIREAAPSDAAVLLENVEFMCRESDFTTMAPGEFSLTEEEEADLMQKYRAADDRLFLVAMIDGALVGSLNFSAGTRVRLRHRGSFGVGVRRHEWGNGIASRLIDTMIGWARGVPTLKKINLQVRADNERGIQLYYRKGFVLEGTIAKDHYVDGVYHDVHCMGLDL